MPSERAPTPQSNTTVVSLGNCSDDRNSEYSDSTATVEISRADSEPENVTRTPSELTEVAENCDNVSRHRTPNADEVEKKFTSDEVPDFSPERKRSNGISKGVILKAMNFGSYNLNYNPDQMKEKADGTKDQELYGNGSLSPKVLEAGSESDLKTTDDEKAEEKKKMSLPRKIAFGFSFLPSVMFVLTFAVILPCEDYKPGGSCAENRWSLKLNGTEITAGLGLLQTLLLGFHFVNETNTFDGIANLNGKTGNEIWKLPLDSRAKYLECEKADANEDGVEDCLTILENGDVCAFNLSDGHKIWTFNPSQKKEVTVLLSGCPHYKSFKSMAVASYGTENTLGIDVLSSTDGSVLASKEVKLVDKCLTFDMKPWKHDNETDLVYFCEDVQNFGYVWRVRENLWCSPGDQNIIVPQLLMRFDRNETVATYIPTNEGVLVWVGTQLTFLEPGGSVKWQDSTPYLAQNRVAKFGNFYSESEQLALIGQNGSSGVVISVVRSEDGKELNTTSIPGVTLNQVITLQGNETDDLLISVLKVNVDETEQRSNKEIVLLSNGSFSSDFSRYIPYTIIGNSSIVEQLILFRFEGNNLTHIIHENEIPVLCSNGGVCEPEYRASHIVSASTAEEDNSINLKIVTLKTPNNSLKQDGSQLVSELIAFDITHQDDSVVQEKSCSR